VFRSDDLGASWDETDGGAIRFPASSDASLERVWQLVPGLADDPDRVWAGAEPASLWVSDDGGVSFSLVDGLWDHPHRKAWQPGGGGLCLHTVVLHPTDRERMTVAISAGGGYRSDDGGTTWEAANAGITVSFMPEPEPEFGQCVHKIAANPSRPEQLFLQNHGGVFRSDDGGGRWQPIDAGLPANFGFPIVAHPHRAGTAYVFPLTSDERRMPPDGKARVYRTTDAGDTWEPLGDGLPHAHAYFTVLRDAMCADGADPVGLYVGTRSGEVFASRDEGGSWASVARHLPDVLVVRASELG
jgi:photosystem II stability/assembly factor-like uncharacterized protein